MRKFFATFMLLGTIVACESEPELIIFKSIELPSAYQAEISVVYDKAEGNNEISVSINSLIEKTIVETIGLDSAPSNLMSAIKSFDNQYINFNKDYPDSTLPKWELHVETENVYQSEEVITMAISVYQYQGGAHGNDQIKLLNISPSSGYEIGLDDIIIDKKDFEALAKAHFIKNLKNKEEEFNIDDYFFGEPFQLPENIGFGEEGFILLYNVYEVASYAQGYTEFIIPYEEMEPYLKLY